MMTREEALEELRQVYEATGTSTFNQLPTPLYLALLAHFGGVRAARNELGIHEPKRTRVWDRDSVLAELRRLHREGKEVKTTTIQAVRGLLGAIANHVGTLRQARALAGVPDPKYPEVTSRQTWDDLEVVRAIEQRARNGEPLSPKKVPTALYSAACKHCGSWRTAIEAAGLDYAEIRLVRQPWTKSEVIEELKRLHQLHPTMHWTALRSRSIQSASDRVFGSLEAALQAAQIQDWPRQLCRRVLPSALTELRDALCELAERGVPLTATRVAEENPRLMRVIRRTIPGTWHDVLETLDLEDPDPPWTRERVLAELRRVHAAGEPLNARHNQALASAARSLFGSLAAAAAQVGASVRSQRHWTREEVLAELRALAQQGQIISKRRVPRSLVEAAAKLFGSWSVACHTAGVETAPSGHRIRSTKAEPPATAEPAMDPAG